MSDQLLLRFLNAGLINVGGDDAKLDRLRQTAGDLAAALKKTPTKAVAFALVAFDPEAPTDDPVITEAAEALQKRWATYVNTFSGTPVAVIRAMLLDALVEAAEDDHRVGVALVASARNALPFMEAGNERAIWADVVADIERRVDARAESEWAVPNAIAVPAMAFAAPESIKIATPSVKIDEAGLAKKFEAAAGPQSTTGGTGGNPHWPQPNSQVWVTEFGRHLAKAVAEALTLVIKNSQIGPVDLSVPLKDLAEDVATHVDGTLKAVSGATAGLQRRTNLIWWKETLYSPSVRVSYRGMSGCTAAALMAFDLHQQVPTFSPASVAAFLHEAVVSLPTLDPAAAKPIRDLLNEGVTSPELAPLRETAARFVEDLPGRGPILKLLGHGSRLNTLDDATFRAQVGLPAATPLTPPQWATWLFRELQAVRAAHDGAEAKKRGRKS